jgi:hypothetical protein
MNKITLDIYLSLLINYMISELISLGINEYQILVRKTIKKRRLVRPTRE